MTTSVILVASTGAPALEADLATLGIAVVLRSEPQSLVGDVARSGAEAVVAWDSYPAGGLLKALDALQQHAPLPVLLFTSDAEAATLDEALRCGVHAYVVNGYAPARLRPLLQLARMRFAREAALRLAHDDLTHKFEERKLVDRAKGILMRTYQISEDEAFQRLRQVSMREQQRVGLVSRRVIDAARDADAVNRAGQLRMLSQRLVKLFALRCTEAGGADAAGLQEASAQQVTVNLEHLARVLSSATFGDLLEAVVQAWRSLAPLLQGAPRIEDTAGVDGAAERVLEAAEALTAALEAASPLATLAIVNRCGRQRMLSQRLAKQALLATLTGGAQAQSAAAAAVRSIESFEASLRMLEQLPLSSAPIRAELEQAAHDWQAMLAGLHDAASPAGRAAIAAGSETLLVLFERLTALYARAAQQLLERA